jgi:hypothetical protein
VKLNFFSIHQIICTPSKKNNENIYKPLLCKLVIMQFRNRHRLIKEILKRGSETEILEKGKRTNSLKPNQTMKHPEMPTLHKTRKFVWAVTLGQTSLV